MSKWQNAPKFVAQQNIKDIISTQEHIIKSTVSFASPYVPSEADLIIARGHQKIKTTKAAEEREIWMKHYHFHLKEMYSILIKKLEKTEARRHISFDQFRMYAYYSTQTQFVPGVHKRVRILI